MTFLFEKIYSFRFIFGYLGILGYTIKFATETEFGFLNLIGVINRIWNPRDGGISVTYMISIMVWVRVVNPRY